MPLVFVRKLREVPFADTALYHATLALGSTFQGAYNLRAWVCDADDALLWCTVQHATMRVSRDGRQAPELRASGTRAIAIGASHVVRREDAGRVA